jgi:hypothetical protein
MFHPVTVSDRPMRLSFPLLAPCIAAVFSALACLSTLEAVAQTAKPRLPPGRDPSGTAIGLITTGIDYTDPAIARCLARDGEGELIGWDLVDRDRMPYARHQPGSAGAPALAISMIRALSCPGRFRIVPVRVDPADPTSLSKAIAFLAETPARTVIIPSDTRPQEWTPFIAATIRYPGLTFVLAAGAPFALPPLPNVHHLLPSAPPTPAPAPDPTTASTLPFDAGVWSFLCSIAPPTPQPRGQPTPCP